MVALSTDIQDQTWIDVWMYGWMDGQQPVIMLIHNENRNVWDIFMRAHQSRLMKTKRESFSKSFSDIG